ncbi:MAG: DNA sulfur modification protein DndD [Gammaproteobacteria bacterium]|nr:DNA sulfur modification protein DndD [Gammaproteobacteria bacterium]
MILKTIKLYNFRVFSGVHEVNLEPKTTSNAPNHRPIVLFGGLNGSGKTSILSAIRLGLYGRNSLGVTTTNDEYTAYLESLIHQGNSTSDSKDSASVELQFEYNHNGEKHNYTVIRSWKKGQQDNIQLFHGDSLKEELSNEQSQGFLNELIPIGVADLFFFDGEKIAELAEDESGVILRTAVQRLLGLDLVAKLQSDLSILLKRSDIQKMPENVKKQITKLEEQQRNHEQQAELLENKVTTCRTSIISIKQQLAQTEQLLSQNGGEWARSRQDEQKKVDELLIEKTYLEKIIRLELDSFLPLSLAPKTLSQLMEKLENESRLKTQIAFKSELETYIHKVSLELKNNINNSSTVMTSLNNVAKNYKQNINESELVFDISDRELANLQFQINDASLDSKNRFLESRDRLKEIEYELEKAGTNIARAPDKERLDEQLKVISILNQTLTHTLLERKELIHETKREYREAASSAKKIQHLHNKYRDDDIASESIQNAINAGNLLSEFSERLKLSRITLLQEAFIDSYKKLARKEDLRLHAEIDPVTFDVSLIDDQERKINRKSLSAGEKQIYAIAILEALAKASGHKLPVIIDTPLGRLDSKHRDKLIKYYFPNASHQVVILSTDTEVDQEYLDWMSDSISHAYEIQFDQTNRSSTLKSGYFWKNDIAEVI